MYLNIFSPLQFKNKPHDGDLECAFILGPYIVRLRTAPVFSLLLSIIVLYAVVLVHYVALFIHHSVGLVPDVVLLIHHIEAFS
jgi:hypothetical protein